eukprot:403333291
MENTQQVLASDQNESISQLLDNLTNPNNEDFQSSSLPLEDILTHAPIPYEYSFATQYMNQRSLILVAQVLIVLLVLIKYLYPKGLKNTQQKLIAFMYILATLQVYRSIDGSQPIIGINLVKYYLVLICFAQSLMSAFKVSTLFKSQENAVIERVVLQQEQVIGNSDRVYELRQNPFSDFFKISILNILAHLLIVGISVVRVLQVENILEVSTSMQIALQDRNFIIPIDMIFLSIFIIIYQSTCEYIGLNEIDYWQYFTMRTIPFICITIQVFAIDGLKYYFTLPDPSIDYTFFGLALVYLLHFIFSDFQNSTDSTLSDYFEEQFDSGLNSNPRKNRAKKVTVENNSKKLKMLIYCEDKSGGVQGILMDFYIDESGNIANEFFRIDSEGTLVKIEQGIKPLQDKDQIEKVFKQYFLK